MSHAQDTGDTDVQKGPLYGRIVDDRGNPVTDAKLTLQGPSYLRSQTDENGYYAFVDATKPGEHRLRIECNSAVGISDYRKMPKILIDPDAVLQKDFTLPRACQVHLQIVDEDDKPIRGVAVYSASLADERFRNSDSDRSVGDGKVTVGGLMPSDAKYIIGIQSKNYVDSHLVVSASDPDQQQSHKVVLKDGKTVRGKAICSDGLPAAGWHILAMPSWWHFGASPRGELIGDDGSFELPHIGDGAYNVTISIPLGERMSTSRGVLSDADLLKMEQPITVKLDYPSPQSMVFLQCKIRWIGKPLEDGFRIDGYSTDTRHHISHYVKPGTTDVKIGPIPRGTYRIRPEDPELEVLNLRKIKNLSDLDHVKVPTDEPLQIVVRARDKPRVQGQVIDAETKAPVTQYRYRVTKLRTLSGPNYVQSNEWKIAKDKQGKFQCDVVGPGIYVVTVWADGYAIRASDQVNTVDQSDTELAISLDRGVSLRGKVVDADGKPLDGATVRALSLSSGSMPRVMGRFATMSGAVKTDAGEFVIDNLAEGRETIRVDHPDFVFRIVQGVDVSEAMEPISVQLTRGATIRGRVFDQNGQPQANEPLLFQDDNAYGGDDREAGRFGQVTTDENGFYELDHLPAAWIYVSRPEEWRSMGVVRHAVFAEEGKTHTLNFGGTAATSGRFLINSQPIAGARLQLGGNDSTFGAMKMFARTDDNGEFTFFGAPAGHWNLYREIESRRSEWVKVMTLDVPAHDGVDLGTIDQRSGQLIVQCTTQGDALPERLSMELQQHNPGQMFGRRAAILRPRESPDQPFVFESVSPGDYELVCGGAGAFQVREHIEITAAQIDTTIPFPIPAGKADVVVDVKSDDGEPASAHLVAWMDGDRVYQSLRMKPNQDGPPVYEANDLPAGKYVIRHGNRRDTPALARFELADGESKRVGVTLGESAKIASGYHRVSTIDPSGVYVRCQMQVTGPSERIELSESTIETTIRGPVGEHRLTIDQPGFHSYQQSVLLRSANSISTGESNRVTYVRLQRVSESGETPGESARPTANDQE
ncbi:MAG: carboxypeptidase regulatory-like domain-containing protein [Pirellulaceae bacterium]|nr:carboxypeptidase regulatory-like domain-containing protein [Pirellulaceae bacterium]